MLYFGVTVHLTPEGIWGGAGAGAGGRGGEEVEGVGGWGGVD